MPLRRLVFSLFAIGVAVSRVHAASLNLIPLKPDIFSDSIVMQYNYAGPNGSLTASGLANELIDQSFVHHPIGGPQGFSINATIDSSGTAIVGTLSITGTIGAPINAGTPLLTGSLTAFGFPNSADEPLEFLFRVTGGSLATAAYYGVPGPASIVGVIITQNGSNYVDWAHSWDNFGNIIGAVSDSFHQVPEPASILLFSLLVGPVWASRARRR